MCAMLIDSVRLLPMPVHSIFGCCRHHVRSEVRLECAHSATELHRGHHHHLRQSNGIVSGQPSPWQRRGGDPHGHEGHDKGTSLDLSPQVQGNIGLTPVLMTALAAGT